MEPRDQLAEAARRIGKLVDASASPARRAAARLAAEAPRAKAARAASKENRAAARARAARLGWVPFLGAAARRASEEAEAAGRKAERDWADVMFRARTASELLASARAAAASASRAEALGRRAGPPPPGFADRAAELLTRTKFLAETEGRDSSRSDRLAPRAFALAAEAEALALAWHGRGVPASRPGAPPPPAPAPPPMNVPAVRTAGGRTQLSLDFDGTGQVEEEPRIWLPVSQSRTREMIERGARLDREGPRRGTKLWIPVSQRQKLDQFLPLAFRAKATRFSFPPIRHNAAGQNLHSVFDRASWNHIRTTAYDRAGHRCQICGKQGGGLWSKITSAEERAKSGPVDCHEVWDWEITDAASGVGIQRLSRLIVLCKDCHGVFHEGFTLWKARQAGIEAEAEDYIRARRLLINRCDGATLDAQLQADSAKWEQAKGVGTWVLDLSHLAAQDFMADQTLVLQEGNRAGVTPAQIGGISFSTEDGTAFAATDAGALAAGEPPRASVSHDGVRR